MRNPITAEEELISSSSSASSSNHVEQKICSINNHDSDKLQQMEERLNQRFEKMMSFMMEEFTCLHRDIHSMSEKMKEIRSVHLLKEMISEEKVSASGALSYVQKMLEDKNNILERLTMDWEEFQHLELFWRNDQDLALCAIKRNEHMFKFAGPSLQYDREFGLKAIEASGGYAISEMPNCLRVDREIVLEAVKKFGNLLQYADESLKKDKEIVRAAVLNYTIAIQHADESLKNDKEFIFGFIDETKCGILEYVGKSLLGDKAFILKCTKTNRRSLEFADEVLKKDKELKSISYPKTKHLIDISFGSDQKFTLESSIPNPFSIPSKSTSTTSTHGDASKPLRKFK